MKIKIGDILIVVVIAAIAILLLVVVRQDPTDSLTAVVLVDGVEFERIDLSDIKEPIIVEIDEIDVVITAQSGRISFTSSSCTDKTCINTGWLDSGGDIAVCLPNRVVVKVLGNGISDIDVVAE